jgi:Zn-finger nucleic acid-binding protein
MFCPNCKIELSKELNCHYGGRNKNFPLNYSNEGNTINNTKYVEVEYEYCPRCGYYEIKPSNGFIYDLFHQND